MKIIRKGTFILIAVFLTARPWPCASQVQQLSICCEPIHLPILWVPYCAPGAIKGTEGNLSH